MGPRERLGGRYLLGAYINVNSEVAWSDTSLNQRFALSYTGKQLNPKDRERHLWYSLRSRYGEVPNSRRVRCPLH